MTMPRHRLDEEGRVTVEERFREHLREGFVQITLPRGVLLRPVPEKLPPNASMPPAVEASGEDEAREQAGN